MKFFLVIIILLATLGLYSQNNNTDTFVIKIEPVKPSLVLVREKIKVPKIKFFRSFGHEIIKTPKNIYKVKINGEPQRVKSYDQIASKKRK
ncbi:MAG: hypothetical protein CR982_04580 [Candidatus Cloacimonadota bacterium]|nr:MAG: hypothetical protein CR982_04580 [Candidatus Cloacimonadota bacterium]PIE78930.1 MAG: hypothetical protein CSA15_05305 [Candidatus Delongbacteria bacterium]